MKLTHTHTAFCLLMVVVDFKGSRIPLKGNEGTTPCRFSSKGAPEKPHYLRSRGVKDSHISGLGSYVAIGSWVPKLPLAQVMRLPARPNTLTMIVSGLAADVESRRCLAPKRAPGKASRIRVLQSSWAKPDPHVSSSSLIGGLEPGGLVAWLGKLFYKNLGFKSKSKLPIHTTN